MDTMDAINLLKKYNLYEDAQNECKRKKLKEAPYDMQGHNDVYCNYLNKKWVEIRNKKDILLKIKCVEWDNIPYNPKPVHRECNFVGVYCTKIYCKQNCKYYKDNILELEQRMKELSEAKEALQSAARYDATFR